MADKKRKKRKQPNKLTKIMEDLRGDGPLSRGREKYDQSRAAGGTRTSALKESVSRYKETGVAMRTLRTGKTGGVGEFFNTAGFENLGIIAGALFDKKASKEDLDKARETLGKPTPTDKESAKSSGKVSTDNKKINLLVNSTKQIQKKLSDISSVISKINGGVEYLVDRVAPKILTAKEEGGTSVQVIQYDPFAPQQVGKTGKVSPLKAGKEYQKSATMKASMGGGIPAPSSGTVSRFKDPKEKSFTEEFKKDPILLLRDEMRSNFDKLFEILEDKKDAVEEGCDGGSLLDSAADLMGRRGRKGKGRKRTSRSPRSRNPRTRTPRTRPTPPDPRGPRRPPTATPPAAKSAKWTKFLKYVEKVAPKLYKKVATRLATAGGLALIPGAGWIGSAITILGSAWLAYDIYDLWSEFSDMDESEQDAMDTVSDSTSPAPASNEVVPGQIPDKDLNAPAQTYTPPPVSEALILRSSGNDAKNATSPTGQSAAASEQRSSGSSGPPPAPSYSMDAPASMGIPDINAIPQKTISNNEGKKTVLSALDKKGVVDPKARAAIMAQLAHESGGFTRLSENLNYSPSKMTEIFSYYKANPQEASMDARNPVAIASKAYGNRLGNGPPETGEGYEYRGRGFVQLTGKSNYNRFGVSNPDDLLNPSKAAENAVDYMLGYKGDWGDVASVTQYVNVSSMLGLGERAGYFAAFQTDPDVIGSGAAAGTPASSGGGSVASATGGVSPASSGGGGDVASAPASSGGGSVASATGISGASGGGVTGSAGGDTLASADTSKSITKSQTDAMMEITAQNRAKTRGISIEQAKSELSVGTPSERGEGITKSQTSSMLEIIAQNKAKKEGISIEQARMALSVGTPSPVSQTAMVQPTPGVSGQGLDIGSQIMEMGKSALSSAGVPPVIINSATKGASPQPQQKQSPMSILGEVATRAAESAFSRAISKDFSHPTAFTTIGTI